MLAHTSLRLRKDCPKMEVSLNYKHTNSWDCRSVRNTALGTWFRGPPPPANDWRHDLKYPPTHSTSEKTEAVDSMVPEDTLGPCSLWSGVEAKNGNIFCAQDRACT